MSCGPVPLASSPVRRPSSSDRRQTVSSALLPTWRTSRAGPGLAANARRMAARRAAGWRVGVGPGAVGGSVLSWRRSRGGWGGLPEAVAGGDGDGAVRCGGGVGWARLFVSFARGDAARVRRRMIWLAASRMQPLGVPAGIALVLPDRDARLDLVDDPAAGLEGGVAMGGAGADPDRELADRQLAGAVHGAGLEDVEPGQRFVQDACALGLGQFDIGLVAQA